MYVVEEGGETHKNVHRYDEKPDEHPEPPSCQTENRKGKARLRPDGGDDRESARDRERLEQSGKVLEGKVVCMHSEA